MIGRFLARALWALGTVSIAVAAQGQPAAPVAKQLKAKSAAEAQALKALVQIQDADARIKAVDEFVIKFPDSEFKSAVLVMQAETNSQNGDHAKAIVSAEQALEADPKSYMAMLILARTIAQTTKEFDLDREEKLGRAEKYANSAMEILKTAPKPSADVPDDQWAQRKADFIGQAHEALGLAAMARKDQNTAIAEFKAAIENSSPPDPATLVRLGSAYNLAKRYDEAIAMLDRAIAMPDALPRVRQIAQSERARSIRAKAAAAKAAAPAPSETAPAPSAASPAAPPAPPAPAAAPAPPQPQKP
jgi:tetratricopeptide (TPR) repeat protein